MFISKNGKRLMAYIMSMAILLSGLIYAPKTADAAGGEPTVTVLGATIRLSGADDNKDGYQSMRIGIKVANAENAKSCSIKLALGNKSYIVSTKEVGETVAGGEVKTQMTNLCEKGSDYVTYAVVIKNIPKDSFYEQVHITGYADAIESESEVSSTPEARNVMGVVNALQEKYPELGIHINDAGTLCKTGDVTLAAEDLDGYSDKPPVMYELENLDISNTASITPIYGCAMEYNNESNSLIISDGTGFAIPLSNKLNKNDKVEVTVYGNCEGDAIPTIYLADSSDNIDTQRSNRPNITLGQTYELTSDKDAVDSFVFRGLYSAHFTKVTISKITVKYIKSDINPAPVEPGLLDLSKASGGTYEPDTGLFDVGSDHTEVHIPLSETVHIGETIQVEISVSKWGTSTDWGNTISGNFRAWISPQNDAGNGNYSTPVWLTTSDVPAGSAFKGTVTLTATGSADCDNLTLKPSANVGITGLVISKIKVTKVAN